MINPLSLKKLAMTLTIAAIFSQPALAAQLTHNLASSAAANITALQTAITNMPVGDTMVVTGTTSVNFTLNVEENKTVLFTAAGTAVTITLNGSGTFILSSTIAFPITVPSGSGVNVIINSTAGAINFASGNTGGSLTVNDGTISSIITKYGTGNMIVNGGTIDNTINLYDSGNLTVNRGFLYRINANGTGNITLSGGTVSNTISIGTGNIIVNGGTVSSTITLSSGNAGITLNSGAISSVSVSSGNSGNIILNGGRASSINLNSGSTGNLTIDGVTLSGTITMNGSGDLTINSGTISTISGNNGIINVNGGRLNTSLTGTVNFSGGTINSYSGSGLNMTGGVITGTVTQTGNLDIKGGRINGAISVTDGNFIASGSTEINNSITASNNVTISGNVKVNNMSGTAIATNGQGSIVTINGAGVEINGQTGVAVSSSTAKVNVSNGKLFGSVIGIETLGRTAEVNVTGGKVSTASGVAIYTHGSHAKVTATAGSVQSGAGGLSISSTGQNSTVSVGGVAVVFGFGPAILGASNVIDNPTFSAPTELGMVIAFDEVQSLRSYVKGETTDLITLPENKAKWEQGALADGIDYENSTNTGFIEIPNVSVLAKTTNPGDGPVTDPGDDTTPTILPQLAAHSVNATTMGKNIVLQNLPQNAKVQVYSLNGKQIHSYNSENSQILRIPVQTGVYIVKINKQTMRVAVK